MYCADGPLRCLQGHDELSGLLARGNGIELVGIESPLAELVGSRAGSNVGQLGDFDGQGKGNRFGAGGGDEN